MNSASDEVLVAEREGDTLALTLNRPHKANALDEALTEALLAAVTAHADARLCVIRGNGKHFCAGFDLADIESLGDGDLLWRFLRIETLLQAIHHAPFATLALAQGQIVGAGADLVAACWQRVLAPSARLRMPGWNFELALGTRRLTRLIGGDAARDLLIDTRTADAQQALESGLASAVHDTHEWPGVIEALAARTGALPRTALTEMLRLTVHDSREQDIAAIVASAARPGLKQRILAFRDRSARQRR